MKNSFRGVPYTAEQTKILKDGFAAGDTDVQIATALTRAGCPISVGGVASRRSVLGLNKRNNIAMPTSAPMMLPTLGSVPKDSFTVTVTDGNGFKLVREHVSQKLALNVIEATLA